MKCLLLFVCLTSSLSVFAQEKIVLNSETTLINSAEAIIMRTGETPAKVEVYLNVPMTKTVCTEYIRVRRGRGSHRECVKTKLVTPHEADKVKISFEDLSALGGSETETYSIKAQQRAIDSKNVLYTIKPLQTLAPYKVISKGILGYDSYSIELK